MKRAYFGGSFDPPHPGHLGAARGALLSGRCDEVLFAPAWSPPHKLGRRRASYADRAEMVKLLIAGLPDMQLSLIEGELQKEPSYTVDILDILTQRLDEKPLLLIGGDSLRDLHTWHEAKRLVHTYEILTYPRRETTPDKEELLAHWSFEETEKLLSGVLPGKFFEISSTELRFAMEKNTKRGHIIEEELPEALRDFMQSRGLYHERRAPEMEKESTAAAKSVTPEELAGFCLHAAEEKLAEDLQLIPVRGVSSITDFFVIGTATSEPHLRALASFVERQVREKYQKRVLTRPDESAGGWVLLDFGNVIVHLMTEEMRERYNLEGLWGENIAAHC